MKYNQPFDQPSNPNAPYVDGNPSAGIQGSIVPAAAVEYPQREIVKTIADVALATPVNTDLTQLSTAVRYMRPQYLVDQGAANAIVIVPNPAPPTWLRPFTFILQIAQTNTSPTVTCTIAGVIGGVTVTDEAGMPPGIGDLVAGSCYLCTFDGTHVRILSSTHSGGGTGPSTGPVVGLTAPLDLYVNGATGSDSNDGRQATVGAAGVGPFATIQRACNVVAVTALNGYTITIHVADWIGNFYAPIQLPRLSGVGNAIIVGNDTTPQNVHIKASIGPAIFSTSQGTSGWIVHGVMLSAPVNYTSAPYWPGAGIWMATGGAIQCYNLAFGACAGAYLLSQSKAIIQMLGIEVGGAGFMTILGSAPVALWADRDGEIDTDGVIVNINTAVNWSVAYAYASFGSIVCCQTSTINLPGNGTGVKAKADMNSVVYSVGTTVPGNAAPVTATGGQVAVA